MIIRISKDKSNPYVIINKQFLQDKRLSWKAKGIMAYLLSLPDDWQIYEEELSDHSDDGIKALKSGIKELLDLGYMKRTKVRNKQGRYSGWQYDVHETAPTVPFSDVGFSDVRKWQPTNNESTNNNITEYNNDNDNGTLPCGKGSECNQDVVNAMMTYMIDFYPQRTKKKHPHLKTEQYRTVYANISAFVDEYSLDYDGIIENMLAFLNSKIRTDFNINHYATEGIMLNRLYETGM